MSSGDDDDETTPPEIIVELERDDGTRFVTIESANEELRRIHAVKIPLTIEGRIDLVETKLDELEIRVLKLKHDLENVIGLIRSIRD